MANGLSTNVTCTEFVSVIWRLTMSRQQLLPANVLLAADAKRSQKAPLGIEDLRIQHLKLAASDRIHCP